jgi:translation initiation factor 3 subunit B
VEEEVRTERKERGLPEDPLEGLIKDTEGEDQVIEELVEEIVEETEEIIP